MFALSAAIGGPAAGAVVRQGGQPLTGSGGEERQAVLQLCLRVQEHVARAACVVEGLTYRTDVLPQDKAAIHFL